HERERFLASGQLPERHPGAEIAVGQQAVVRAELRPSRNARWASDQLLPGKRIPYTDPVVPTPAGQQIAAMIEPDMEARAFMSLQGSLRPGRPLEVPDVNAVVPAADRQAFAIGAPGNVVWRARLRQGADYLAACEIDKVNSSRLAITNRKDAPI